MTKSPFKFRLILLALGAASMSPETVLYNKERTAKSTYPFGNHMGATVEVSHGGKRETVRFLPDTAYVAQEAFVILQQTTPEGGWEVYREKREDTAFMHTIYPDDYPLPTVPPTHENAKPKNTGAIIRLTGLMMIQNAVGETPPERPAVRVNI